MAALGDLRGQVALVTGASSGIGAELARTLTGAGCAEVWLVARRADRLQQLAAELGSAARVHVADLTDPAARDGLFMAVPHVDVLINNAGFGWANLLLEQSQGRERLLDMVALNCTAVLDLTHHYAPAMVRQGRGWIMVVGSTAGFVPMPTMAVYGATKAFANSLCEALHTEFQGTGVRVHLLAPGPVETEFFEVARPGKERPLGFLFMDAGGVARSALQAMAAGRARTVPGLPYDLGFRLVGKLPGALRRRLQGFATRSTRNWVTEPGNG